MTQLSTDQTLHLALSHQKAGRLAEAQALYQQILAAEPRNPHALHLLGTIAMHAGQPQAEGLIRAALAELPDYHEARFNLAVLLLTRDRPAEALPLIEQLLEARVELADLDFQHANALRALGRVRESIPIYQQAVAAQPDNTERLNNLGVALKDDGQFNEAADIFRQVVQRQDDNAAAWTNLGSTLKELGQLDAAIDSHRRAIAIRPNLQQAHCNLANALQTAGRFDDAVQSFQTAIALGPDFAVAHYNFGNCLLEMGRLDEAVSAFLRAVTLQPDLHQALGNLGNALKHSGQLDQAIAVNRKALTLRPDIPEFHFNLALLLLLRGQIVEGWREYEWRLQTSHYLAAHRQQYTQPQWDGSPLLGRSLFIHCEQGLGDTIHFARYAAAVAAKASPSGSPAGPGQVCLQIPDGLSRLFRCLENITLVGPDSPPPQCDLRIPLLSLPHALGEPVFAAMGAATPYLRADPARRFNWRRRLADAWRAGRTTRDHLNSAPLSPSPFTKGEGRGEGSSASRPSQPRLRVGLVWAGGRSNANDKRRSISLADYAPLARADVQFVSLQVGPAAGEAKEAPPGMTLFDASPHLTDMADTADLIAELDLVITVDTAVAHLAGAMAKPVWNLISRIPDFRWLLDRTDTPWYPTMILFRQRVAGQWSDPIGQLKRALDAVVAGARPADVHKLLATQPAESKPARGEPAESAPTSPAADAEALCRQGDQLARDNHINEAIAHYQRALQINPNHLDALTNLGNALNATGRAADALIPLDRALRLSPLNPDVLTYRGCALTALGQLDAAVESLQSALRERPAYTMARLHLANALADRHELEAAIDQLHQVIAENPDLVLAHFNLARCHIELQQPALALPALDQALRLSPGHAGTLSLRGTARGLLGQFDAADVAFRQSILLQPNAVEPHMGLAIALLVRGQYEAGWAEYEWRRRPVNKSVPIRRDLHQPDWDGSPLDGRSILIHAEQGKGDTIQFCRYVPEVVARGGNVIFECPPSLHRLIEFNQLAPRVEASALPGQPARYYSPVDVQLPLLSLPRVLKQPAFGQGGKPPPYLRADPKLIDCWQSRLAGATKRRRGRPPRVRPARIGLVWAGASAHPRDRIRSIPLAALAPLARDGVQFVSLQVGNAANQLQSPPTGMNILDMTADITDFADTAAILTQLDLIITVDTAVAHLAGAMGRPVWVLLASVPDFRWLLDRCDTPWYPSMRLYRQPQPADWSTPIAAIARDLSQWLIDRSLAASS